MAKPAASPYACSECGWTGAKWYGRCPECQVWGSIVERGRPVVAMAAAKVPEGRVAKPITAVSTTTAAHWPSGIPEFDRVLGGGLVAGAAILLSGEPGVGKSTLLLEVASRAARTGQRVLYVSAEESASQVRLRAERTGALADELFLAAETDLATILGHIDDVRPQLVIVDSVQTVSSAMSDGAAGQPAQVREVAATLIRIANGGAGAAGLIEALAYAYLRTHPRSTRGSDYGIAWYLTDTTYSLAALQAHVVDIALTYDEGLEQQAVAAGNATRRDHVFMDHFLIAGPPANPAALQPGDSAPAAMLKIADRGCTRPFSGTVATDCAYFLSRDDRSATGFRPGAVMALRRSGGV